MASPMRIAEAIVIAFRGARARLRRDAVAYAICIVCAIGALVLATWASVLALSQITSPVHAPLIVAGCYALIGLATFLWLQRARTRASILPSALTGPSQADAPRQQQPQFAQIAMIIEAVLLGYYLSRRSDRR
jgi:hypothetical protein